MNVLQNARLIDGTGASPVSNVTVVIDGNRITEVTARNQSDFPADAEVIDVAGMTVLPGLIDCHDHMANHAGTGALEYAGGPAEAASIEHRVVCIALTREIVR